MSIYGEILWEQVEFTYMMAMTCDIEHRQEWLDLLGLITKEYTAGLYAG